MPFYFIISQASDILNEFGKKGSKTAAGKKQSRGVIAEKAILGIWI